MSTRPRHLELVNPNNPQAAARPHTDAELVAALQKRDERAAAVLYDQLLPVVDAAIRRVSGERPFDYEDLVQVIFEQIVRTIVLDRYAQSCSLSSWATLIASRVAINALRSRIRERRVLDRGTEARSDLTRLVESPSLEHKLEARSEISRLQHALAGLNAGRREAVILHDVFGYGLTEVAELTGVGIRAAQSRLFRGRQEMMERLAKNKKREGK